MEYQIVSMVIQATVLGSMQFLVDKVNGEIAKGWEPQGGIAISSESNNFYPMLFQAMVKKG